MELGIKLSYIEDIKISMQKRHLSLKTEYKREGRIASGNIARAKVYATEMYKSANNHYLEEKYRVEGANKTDKVAKQFSRTMKSIKNYRDKILEICK
jgi:hypothetical protein